MSKNERTNQTIGIIALCAALAATGAEALSVSAGSETSRSTSSGGEQISGITWAGGNLYYAVNDNDGKIFPITITVNSSSGAISANTVGTGVSLSGADNLEGCAFDPATGNVWVSTESDTPAIIEYNPTTGAKGRTVNLPPIFKSYCRGNFKLEALTISGDGLTMWTANEESLSCDGPISTTPRATGGTTVRLLKLTRASVNDNWTPAAQYAYKTYGLNTPKAYHNAQRSGVSGLCALPDGTLLVLERECSGAYETDDLNSIWTGLSTSMMMAICVADYSSASDVSTLPSLESATYTPVTKTDLFNASTSMANYEGICLGPRNSNGSTALLFVSDGGSGASSKIMSKNLSGLDVRTLYVEGAADSEPVGGPYRHVGGTTFSATLSRAGSPYEANLAEHMTWKAAANSANGVGSPASFTVNADDTLQWATETNASPQLVAADSFERIDAGTEADGIAGWSGEDGCVVATNYTWNPPPGYPLAQETHSRILTVDGDVVRDYADIPARGVILDTMVRVTKESADSPVADVDATDILAFYFDEEGHPVLQHRAASGGGSIIHSVLSTRTFANGDWLRVAIALTNVNAMTWCQVRIDGIVCASANGCVRPGGTAMAGAKGIWHRAISDRPEAKISAIALKGTGAVDDVALYTANNYPEFDKGLNTTGNEAFDNWLIQNGLPLDPNEDVDGDGFSSEREWKRGTDPWDKTDHPPYPTILKW